MATLPTRNVAALTWIPWAQGSANLASVVVCNFDEASSYEIVPAGPFNLQQLFATGVVIRNLDNDTPVTAWLGPMSFTVSAFKQDALEIKEGFPALRVTGQAGLVEVIFYRGNYPAALQNSNDYKSQQAASMATLTSGNIDAYLNSLRWNENILLDAGTDFNDITVSGFYDCVNPVNAPAAGTWHLQVYTHSLSASWLLQRATTLDQGTTQTYERRRVNGVWGVWTSVSNGTQDIYARTLRAKTIAQIPSSSNLNNIKDVGVYDAQIPSNAPLNNRFWYLEVFNDPDDPAGYLMQRVTDAADAATYVRRCSGGVWSSWRRVALQDDDYGAGAVGSGRVALIGGNASNPGYVQFTSPDGTRRGFMGWADGSNIAITTENGWGLRVNGRQLDPAGRPAFLARLSANAGIANGTGAIAFGSVAYNRGNNLFGTRFTASLAGPHHFVGAVQFTTSGTGDAGVSIRLNGAEVETNYQTHSAGGFAARPIAATLNLAVGDYVELAWGLSGGTGTWALENFRTYFSGHYLG